MGSPTDRKMMAEQACLALSEFVYDRAQKDIGVREVWVRYQARDWGEKVMIRRNVPDRCHDW